MSERELTKEEFHNLLQMKKKRELKEVTVGSKCVKLAMAPLDCVYGGECDKSVVGCIKNCIKHRSSRV